MHHVVLSAAQSDDLTAGALAAAGKLCAIFADRSGLVGKGPKHGRPVNPGGVIGAGVAHRN